MTNGCVVQVGSSSAVVLAITDGADPRGKLFQSTILPVLRFWGVPLHIFDLADPAARLPGPDAIALILVAQEGIAPSRLATLAEPIAAAARAGAGIVLCDPALAVDFSAGNLRLTDRGWAGVRPTARVSVTGSHWVTGLQTTLRSLALRKRLPAVSRAGAGGETVLAGEDSAPLIVVRDGPARVVEWGLSTSVWSEDFFGFGRGLDALFWRGMLWAARKPFAMAAFPPFGRFRFDDCQGFWRGPDDLAFLDVMGEYGERPNLCVCLSALTDGGWRVLAERALAGEIEVSPHVSAPEVGIFNVAELADGPAVGDPLAAQIRSLFAAHQCPIANSLSDHNHELSPRGVRIARSLGMTARMNVLRVGETWDGLHRTWHPAPYGRLNYALEALVDAPDLFTAINHHVSFADSFTRIDEDSFLCTPFGGFTTDRWDFLNALVGPDGNDIERIIERLTVHTELALNSLFFTGSISHTHFMRHLSADDWGRVLAAYHGFAAPHGYRPRRYGEIADYAAWRARIGEVAIAAEPAIAGTGPELWGVIATEAAGGVTLAWQPLRYSTAPAERRGGEETHLEEALGNA